MRYALGTVDVQAETRRLMTTLFYPSRRYASAEEYESDLKFGRAVENMARDPEASRVMLLELGTAGGRIAGTALRELYRRYSQGDALPKDGQRALVHLMEAVELGDSIAQLLLAREYRRGELDRGVADPAELVPEDRSEALRWYRAAAQSNRTAQTELAEFLRDDRQADAIPQVELAEIEANYEKAGSFFTLSLMYCDDTVCDACTPENFERANKWLLRGSQAGCELCDARLKEWANSKQERELAAVKSPVPNPTSAVALGVKRSDEAGLLTTILSSAAAIALWSAVGGALVALVIGIQSVAFPILTGVALLALVIKVLRRR